MLPEAGLRLRFQPPKLLVTLCEELGGSYLGPPARQVVGLCPPEQAKDGLGSESEGSWLVPWFSKQGGKGALEAPVGAGLVLLTSKEGPGERWLHQNPRWVLAKLLQELQSPHAEGIHRSAVVEPGAEVHPSAQIAAFAHIQQGARIGAHSRVGSHSVIYPHCVLGKRCSVGSHSVVGQPGFGRVPSRGADGSLRWEIIPHLGGVVVGDDVTIGSHCTIDAGVMSPTRIGNDCHLDSHVHIGHNVQLGASCVMAAQSGIAGSTRVGRGVMFGGQTGVGDHLEIGDGVQVAARSAVLRDVDAGAKVAGYPAIPLSKWLRNWARLVAKVR